MGNQSALDWLLEEWPILESQIPPRIIEQAKAMEKEQIIDAYIMGSYDMAAKEFKPEQYFNETYGN